MHKGFTLIELVIVILLLGILAAFAVPKWLGKGGGGALHPAGAGAEPLRSSDPAW